MLVHELPSDFAAELHFELCSLVWVKIIGHRQTLRALAIVALEGTHLFDHLGERHQQRLCYSVYCDRLPANATNAGREARSLSGQQ